MISVVIPACNEERYIKRTLRSVPRGRDVEVVVVCNGCSDGTARVARGFARVLLLKQRNVSVARNVGARCARGEVLVFLDADTLVSEDLFVALRRLGGGSFVGTCRVRPDSGRWVAWVITGVKNVVGWLGFHNASGVVFCSRGVFERMGGFDEGLRKRENGDFARRARRFGRRVFLRCCVTTSMRRFERLGYGRALWFWVRDVFVRGREYPVVR